MSQLGTCASCDASIDAPAPASRHLFGAQAGFSLMEILVTIMLVSVAVVALALGFLTLVRTNRSTYEQQQVDHAATNYAESLKASQYEPCAPAAAEPDYSSGTDLWAPSGGVQVQVIDVEYWNSSSRTFQPQCPGSDAGAQRLTIRAQWGDHDRQAQIVKRNR